MSACIESHRSAQQLFEAGGFQVSSASEPAELPQVGSVQPSAATTADTVIQRGQKALARLERNLVWGDWCEVAVALAEGRTLALRTAGTNKPQGRKYREAMGRWLRCYGFDRIHKSDRSRLLKVFDRLDAINGWRSALPLDRQLELNHPRIVLAHWRRSQHPPEMPHQEAEESPEPRAPSLEDSWAAACANERAAFLDSLGHEGLCASMSQCLSENILNPVSRL